MFDLDNTLVKAHYKKHKLESFDACVYMNILNSKKVKVSNFNQSLTYAQCRRVVIHFVPSIRERNAGLARARLRANTLLSAAQGVHKRPCKATHPQPLRHNEAQRSFGPEGGPSTERNDLPTYTE